MMSTFQPFSHAPLYVSGTGLSLLLTLPYVLLRRRWPSYTLLVMLEILFVANLMYARTYLEAIPLRSYLIAGNLSEFMPSVWASLRWTDILFLCIPIAAITMCRWPVRHNDYPDHMTPSCTNNSGVNAAKSHRKSRWTARTSVAGYLVWTAIPLAITVAAFPTPEDFRQHYAAFSSGAYSYRSGPAAYSLAGKLLYDHMTSRSGITPSQRRQTIDFMDSRPPVPALPHGVKPRRIRRPRDNTRAERPCGRQYHTVRPVHTVTGQRGTLHGRPAAHIQRHAARKRRRVLHILPVLGIPILATGSEA